WREAAESKPSRRAAESSREAAESTSSRVNNNDQDPEVSTTSELFALANGPSWTPISVNSCVVDGVSREAFKDEAFKDEQDILFSDGGVIVVEDDPDIIYFDNSSDLPLSTSFNDLDNATLHIDGQSTVVDAPPDIIDVPDKDDDITDDEDALPHDLADSDVEDLINVDDDDVARSHGDDGGGEDRSPPPHVPTGCRGCFVNRGLWYRKSIPSDLRFACFSSLSITIRCINIDNEAFALAYINESLMRKDKVRGRRKIWDEKETQVLIETLQDMAFSPRIESKFKWLKTEFHIIKDMLKQSGFQWNDVEKKVACERGENLSDYHVSLSDDEETQSASNISYARRMARKAKETFIEDKAPKKKRTSGNNFGRN
ncbi:hypothetical protein Tco_0903668, partial [Tanacetum coccineum]